MALITKKKDPTSPYVFKYNHVHPDFAKEVEKEFKELDILKYYPYGAEKYFYYFNDIKNDLTKIHLKDYNKAKTEWDYVYSIIEEIGRAMRYLMVHGNHSGYDHQRVKAFALWSLFHSGDIGWSKTPLKGLNEEEKLKLYWKTQKEAEKLSGSNEWSYTPKRNKKERAEHKKLEAKWAKEKLKKYGVYEIRHLPLTQMSNTVRGRRPTIFYTKQELAAIDFIVTCYFNNLC